MKKSRNIGKILLVAVAIALLCALLTSCGLFNSLKAISSATVVARIGLEETADGAYEVQAGKEFTLAVVWNNKRALNPSIEWHEVLDGKDSTLPLFKDEQILTYTHKREDIGKTFSYYAKVNELVRSDSIKINVIEAKLDAPTINCQDDLKIVDGKIQQNIIGGLKDVKLSASWNAAVLDPDIEVTVEWFVNDKKVADGAEYTYSVSGISEPKTVDVTCRVSADGMDAKSTIVSLIFVEKYDLVDSVTVNIDDARFTKIATDTYYVQKTSDNLHFALSASIAPVTANLAADCEWSFEYSGKSIIGDKSTHIENVGLNEGKNIVTATVGNVVSRRITIYYMTYDVDSIPDEIKSAITDKFFWNGNYCDRYVTCQEEVNEFVGYAISRHQKNKAFEMYMPVSNWAATQSEFSDVMSEAIKQGGDESGYYAYNMSKIGTVGKFTFLDGTEFGIPSGAYQPAATVKQATAFLRYSEVENKRESLPIDEKTETMNVANSNDLYRVVSNGFKPVFAADESGQKLQALYNKARKVLIDYISADMTDVEKVAAIYDWIVNEVDYDYAVASLGTGSGTSGYNAFYLEGVFDDKRAVCDGKSKAFALLCGMENIKAIRVSGYARENIASVPDSEKAKYGHAWNKVLVDANNDGVREWYVVDTTWGDVEVGGTSGRTEYLNYGYFLVTDEAVATSHQAKIATPKANTEYNVYKNTFFTYGGATYDFYIESSVERDILIAYSRANGNIAMCVYIKYAAQGGHGYAFVKLGDNQYVVYAS